LRRVRHAFFAAIDLARFDIFFFRFGTLFSFQTKREAKQLSLNLPSHFGVLRQLDLISTAELETSHNNENGDTEAEHDGNEAGNDIIRCCGSGNQGIDHNINDVVADYAENCAFY